MNPWGPNIHVKPDPTDTTTALKTVARMQLGSSISDALELVLTISICRCEPKGFTTRFRCPSPLVRQYQPGTACLQLGRVK